VTKLIVSEGLSAFFADEAGPPISHDKVGWRIFSLDIC